MFKIRFTKRRPYNFEARLSGDFSEEALRLIDLSDVDEVVIAADVGVEWDYDIPMTFVDGDIFAKNAAGEWVNAEAFITAIGAHALISEAVEEFADDSDGSYEADRRAAAYERMSIND